MRRMRESGKMPSQIIEAVKQARIMRLVQGTGALSPWGFSSMEAALYIETMTRR